MFEETYKLKQYGYIDEDMIPIRTINGNKKPDTCEFCGKPIL